MYHFLFIISFVAEDIPTYSLWVTLFFWFLNTLLYHYSHQPSTAYPTLNFGTQSSYYVDTNVGGTRIMPSNPNELTSVELISKFVRAHSEMPQMIFWNEKVTHTERSGDSSKTVTDHLRDIDISQFFEMDPDSLTELHQVATDYINSTRMLKSLVVVKEIVDRPDGENQHLIWKNIERRVGPILQRVVTKGRKFQYNREFPVARICIQNSHWFRSFFWCQITQLILTLSTLFIWLCCITSLMKKGKTASHMMKIRYRLKLGITEDILWDFMSRRYNISAGINATTEIDPSVTYFIPLSCDSGNYSSKRSTGFFKHDPDDLWSSMKLTTPNYIPEPIHILCEHIVDKGRDFADTTLLERKHMSAVSFGHSFFGIMTLVFFIFFVISGNPWNWFLPLISLFLFINFGTWKNGYYTTRRRTMNNFINSVIQQKIASDSQYFPFVFQFYCGLSVWESTPPSYHDASIASHFKNQPVSVDFAASAPGYDNVMNGSIVDTMPTGTISNNMPYASQSDFSNHTRSSAGYHKFE